MSDDEKTIIERRVELSDGVVCVIDINRMNVVEYRKLFDVDNEDKQSYGDEILAKCVDKTLEYIQSIGLDDYLKLSKRFWRLVQEANKPDPN